MGALVPDSNQARSDSRKRPLVTTAHLNACLMRLSTLDPCANCVAPENFAGEQRSSYPAYAYNVTLADMYFGRYQQIIDQRDIIKRQKLQRRRYENLNPCVQI